MMKKTILALFFMIFMLLLTCCRSGNVPAAPQTVQNASALTPTGRPDGKPDTTYVYYNGVLYVRDWSRFAGEAVGNRQADGVFAVYSQSHTLTFLGEIQTADNENLPTEDLAAYGADVGDRLYLDETGALFLLRKDADWLIALTPDE